MRTKITLIFLFTLGALSFIHFSNDHRTCDIKVEVTTGPEGEKITTEEHICREMFSF